MGKGDDKMTEMALEQEDLELAFLERVLPSKEELESLFDDDQEMEP
jgi:hypothetical protein